MEKKNTLRMILLWALILFSIVYCIPTFLPAEAGKDFLWGAFSKRLHYGLDLQGGLELRYTVDWKKAISENGRKLGDTVKSQVTDDLVRAAGKNPSDIPRDEWERFGAGITVSVPEYTTIRVGFAKPEDRKLITPTDIQNLDGRYEVFEPDGQSYDLVLKDSEMVRIREQVVTETRGVIGRRVEALGLVDPEVRIAGDADIVAQIPGIKSKEDMDRVRQLIGKPAQLTFRMVDESSTFFDDKKAAIDAFKAANPDRASLELIGATQTGTWVKAQHKSDLMAFARTIDPPEGRTLAFGEDTNRAPNAEGKDVLTTFWRTYVLFPKVELTGEHLSRARALYDEKNQPYVSLDFNSEGGRLFSDLSGANVGKFMAIMLDDEVSSAPYFKEKISGGRAQITMGRSESRLQEARELETVLNQGAYKAPVYKVHDSEVGPSLGADSVRASMYAFAMGLVLVVGFMAFYYRRSGLVAVVVLGLNLVFMLTLLISFNSALTLPGIAGLILTLGMAVDSNIIIYERIREEITAGRKPRAAVEAGFNRAFWTIFDSQITTALAGVILYLYTTGPIHGFAVTLLIGIATSVFTAVYVSHLIFNWWLSREQPETLSI